MNRFERDLRESLKHREPPADFADKVLARTRASEQATKSWRWLAAAVLVVFMIGGSLLIQERRRQIRDEQAKEQLMVALQITGSKVRLIRERLSAVQQRTIQLQLE